MTYVDNVENPGLYHYSVLCNNQYGHSKFKEETILVGQKCNLTFELFDEGGDGWKGGSISIFKDDERIAKVALEDGASSIDSVPLLNGDLTFVWNKCWYAEPYYTCDEISLVIKDKDGNEVLRADGSLILKVPMRDENGELLFTEDGIVRFYEPSIISTTKEIVYDSITGLPLFPSAYYDVPHNTLPWPKEDNE